jgi:DNA-binding XRE family transcriptional regulator
MEELTMVKFNDVARIKREALMLTQAEFAKLIGCTASTISNFEVGRETGDTTIKCIKFTLKDLESKLSTEELGPYKLRVATEMTIAETDDEARKEKLRNVCFSALKWSQNIDESKKGFYR